MNSVATPLLDSILAGLGLLVCLALLLRFALPAARRRRLDDSLQAGWQRMKQAVQRPRRQQPRDTQQVARQAERQARREADQLIDRARRRAREGTGSSRDGNVIRPDAFRSRPPRDKLH